MTPTPYRVSLIVEEYDGEFEERVAADLNFAALNWNAELVTIKFSTGSYDEGEGIWCAALIVHRVPAESEAQS